MRTLHTYLTRQVVQSLCLTVAVFTFVLLLGNVLKEIIALLVSRQITVALVGQAIGLLIPYVMAYVLPFAMLTATILTFGRFSADQELTAVRAGGISLVSLITPILILSLFLSGLCAMFNLWIAPECRSAYKSLVYKVGIQTADSLITEDRFIDEIPGMVLYVRKRNGNELEDIRLYTVENNRIAGRMSAKRGEILWDQSGKKIGFRLVDPLVEFPREVDPEFEKNFVGPPGPVPLLEWNPAKIDGTYEDTFDLSGLEKDERKPKLSEMNLHELQIQRDELERKGIPATPVRTQISRQVSFSFACFSFALVGIPLAIRAHRRETSIGVAIALGLLLLYYTFFIMADALSANERVHPELLVWLPNLLFQGLGAILLYRANRS